MYSLRTYCLAALFCVAASVAIAHEGHDHGDAPPPITVQTAPRATAASALFQLVAVAQDGSLTVYLDEFDTNTPIVAAVIDVETPAGPAVATPEGEIYRLDAPWSHTSGEHELLFTVTSGSDVDFLTATLSVAAPPAPAVEPQGQGGVLGAAIAREFREVVGSELTDRLGRNDPALIAIGGIGFVAGLFVMALARRRRVAAALAASALILIVGSSLALAQPAQETSLPAVAARSSTRDVAQRLPDSSVFVPKASQRILAIRTLPAAEGEHRRSIELPGRVIADPNATGFVQTAVGGRLAPPPSGFPPLGTTVEAGQVLAYVEPSLAAIDLSSIRQAQAQLDSSIAIAERQVERLGKLIASGSVSRTQLEEAELALVGLREQRTALDDIRLQPERLVAPISGVIAHANASPGLIAESNTEVFHVIEPERLWVEALSYGGEAVSASASIVGEDGERIALTFVGAGFADGSQVQPINFRIENSGREMRPGQVVTVVAETESPTVGIAMTRDAVIRGANGQDIVYVHAAPELFEQRFVRIAPLDGVRVLIVAGVSPGERLVTQGAELLNQLR